jgi:hypothetical protein
MRAPQRAAEEEVFNCFSCLSASTLIQFHRPVQCRYPLSSAMFVRGCAGTFDSLIPKTSYKIRVYHPGNAVSISLGVSLPHEEVSCKYTSFLCEVENFGFGVAELFLVIYSLPRPSVLSSWPFCQRASAHTTKTRLYPSVSFLTES